MSCLGFFHYLILADGEVVTNRVTLANGDELALRLDAVSTPEPPAATDEEAVTSEPVVAGVEEAGANPRLGATEFEALLESLRGKADVEIIGPSSSTAAAYP